jgi:hypothetical protein
LKGVGDGGALATIGAGAVFAEAIGPASVPGIVTATRPLSVATDEPGMNRRIAPSFVPAACPDALTTKA